MKILALTSSYPRYDGDPTAPFIESITEHIAARGHEVHLVLPEHHTWARPQSTGSVYYHQYRYSPLSMWTPWGFSGSLEAGVKIRRGLFALAPVVALSGLRKARDVLSRERFDVIHVHWVIPNGPIGALAARGTEIPVVVSLHGSDVSVAEHVAALARAARWTFERAAAVTAPSQDLLERARRLGATGDLSLLPYGADVQGLQASADEALAVRSKHGLEPEDTVVAAIGRFVHWKGFDYLLDAFAKARSSQPKLRLVFVGDGDLRDELARQAQLLGVSDAVVFTGMVQRSDMPSYLAAADIVAVPSIHYDGYVDGLPNVALEALAAGKALVATRVGGLPELVKPHENGLLVEEKDSSALADALVSLAADPELRRRLGTAGREHMAAERTWDDVAERLEGVYERARDATAKQHRAPRAAPARPLRVLYFGTYERDYPRNAQVMSCMRKAGVVVEERHVSVWEGQRDKYAPRLGTLGRVVHAEARLALAPNTDADLLVVGYPGHGDVDAARRVARGRPIVFNPLVSLEETLVEDRGLVEPHSLTARAIRAVDRRAFRGADLVVADTEAHARYFVERFDLPFDRVVVCYVGAEDHLFQPGRRVESGFHALFVGKLIPLHGVETIVDAARLCPEIEFRVVGSGQQEDSLSLLPPNVRWERWVEYERLPELYRAAGCALGIFGKSDKAARVIPNKAFQALATQTPLVTADTPAARELLEDGRDALLVPAGDPEALAAAVRRLAADADLKRSIGSAGRAVYELHAAEEVLGRKWRETLERLVASSGQP